MADAAPLLIPTRNRTTSLGGVMAFLEKFYPGTVVVIADGSNEEFRKRNQAMLKQYASSLVIDYRSYPTEFPFFERLLDVVRSLDDEHIIMGSDDDFPMMEAMAAATRFLQEHPDYSTALGSLVHLRLDSPDSLLARFQAARPIHADDAMKRATSYSAWPFSTTYAVTRRDVLIKRYLRAPSQFLAGFYDFTVGLHDAMLGKMKAMPTLAFVATRNYSHSYLRKAPLLVLRRADRVLALQETYKEDLMTLAGVDEETAERVSVNLIGRRIAENFGYRPHMRRGFESSRLFQNPMVQRQYGLFNDLFEASTAARAKYQDRLMFIARAMHTAAESDDNFGEEKSYETLEEQLADGSGGEDE